jgi:hypothetical protein
VKNLTDGGVKCDGVYKADQGIIKIDDSLKGERLMTTIIHEWFHAFIDTVKGADEDILSSDAEEIMANLSEVSVPQLLKLIIDLQKN